ncbi:MAG: hypothetical protein AYL30_006230 [Candidatus Hecatellales archaeon B24]|nr:MAG: hypothetical protein AYL30_006230 [Candidatus Hecatellales archaeon B24]
MTSKVVPGKLELGRVRSSKGDKVNLVVTAEAEVSFGQIVKLASPEGGGRFFYARVTNAGSCSTLDVVEELKDLKGSMRTVGPYSQYRDVDAVLFLERDEAGRLRTPTLNPDYGWKAEALTSEDYGSLNLAGDLRLGYLREGGRGPIKEVVVGLNVGFIPRMAAMVGQIGSGKTNAELVLNSELMATIGEAVGLIFDFAGELLTGKNIGKGLIDHPLASTHLEYVGVAEPSGEVNFTPLRIGLKGLNPQQLQWLLSDVSQPQVHYAIKLMKSFGENWVERAVVLYQEEDVEGVRGEVQGSKPVIEALLRKLSNLDDAVFQAGLSMDVAEKIVELIAGGKTVLVDISGLSEETQRQVVTWVVSRVVGHYREMWRSDYEAWLRLPYLLITLEEAHKFLEERGGIFSDIALTHRKYRVGLNAVTPRPSLINRDVFAELWTKLILKTTLREDRVYLSENTPYLEYSDVELKMLDVGEALLVSQPKIQFAVPVKIFDYKEYLEEHLKTKVEKAETLAEARRAEVKRSRYEDNVV